MTTEARVLEARERLESMAADVHGNTWDLSANDQAAIKLVLAEADALRTEVGRLRGLLKDSQERRAAEKERLADAEGVLSDERAAHAETIRVLTEQLENVRVNTLEEAAKVVEDTDLVVLGQHTYEPYNDTAQTLANAAKVIRALDPKTTPEGLHEAIRVARAEGWAEALDAAAKIGDEHLDDSGLGTAGDLIRALAPAQPKALPAAPPGEAARGFNGPGVDGGHMRAICRPDGSIAALECPACGAVALPPKDHRTAWERAAAAPTPTGAPPEPLGREAPTDPVAEAEQRFAKAAGAYRDNPNIHTAAEFSSAGETFAALSVDRRRIALGKPPRHPELAATPAAPQATGASTERAPETWGRRKTGIDFHLLVNEELVKQTTGEVAAVMLARCGCVVLSDDVEFAAGPLLAKQKCRGCLRAPASATPPAPADESEGP